MFFIFVLESEMLTNDLSHGFAMDNLMMGGFHEDDEEYLPKEGAIHFVDDLPEHNREVKLMHFAV